MLYVLAFVGGYVVAVFTWNWLHTTFVGVEAKADALKQQAKDLTAKL